VEQAVQKPTQQTVDQVENFEEFAPLNLGLLNHSTFDDPALRQEILDLFRSHLSGFRMKLLLPMDGLTWRYLNHSLKGAAAAVGAEQIAAAASFWDVQPPPMTLQAREEVHDRFEALTQRFETALASLASTPTR
jgi:hypothetical protein